jgi:hypothetical protein
LRETQAATRTVPTDLQRNDAKINTSALFFQRNSIALNYTDALSSTMVLEIKGGVNRYAPNLICYIVALK